MSSASRRSSPRASRTMHWRILSRWSRASSSVGVSMSALTLRIVLRADEAAPRHLEAALEMLEIARRQRRKRPRVIGSADRIDLLGHIVDGPRRAVYPRGFGDEGLGHAPRYGDQHFAADRARFMGEPA